ncbi:MAG: peptidoglycan/LPS O-acetylase OafA/YrhL [Candidatus Accumulibacter regalis]|jgi:peptidoglycan/LPS O-acetylase OafA/YrhL|uniref:acyltransferase family protein n=1 Tax=Candidatus Accumulibacter sp. ACC005 TaxID=2823331 RepID=UPI0012CA4A7C|nr:acyltransferase [Candidatus Accumulibacter sp. ACC005]MQM35717.1 GTP cyclohydrolase [Candidatus Accumulibacter phosphatis]HRI92527.1 acyltransferase [Accumulibacter sp.]
MAEASFPAAGSRLPFIDALKAVALQLIVLHHLAFYGPMSDHAYALIPELLSWLSQHARAVVQVFLVIGGFLAARSLAPTGTLVSSQPLRLLLKRYLKLAVPYLAALLIGIVCAALARTLMTHESVPEQPTLAQLLAHALLLQGVLGYDGLSAGVWYVAIDFQLFSLLLVVLWLARGVGGGGAGTALVGALLVATVALLSLYYFNRDPAWDSWALYFFGSYALGALSYWAARAKHAVRWLLLIVVAVVAALLFDYRSRIAVALLVALAIGLASRYGFLARWPRSSLFAYLGQISYSVFLIHFPVCLIINGLFTRAGVADPWLNLAGVILAWAASLLAGGLFYRFVESPAQRGFRGFRVTPRLT